MTTQPFEHERRWFLRRSTQLAIGAAALPLAARSAHASVGARSLQLSHTHTGEKISLVYAVGNDYLPQAIGQFNHFLRDHYSRDQFVHIDTGRTRSW